MLEVVDEMAAALDMVCEWASAHNKDQCPFTEGEMGQIARASQKGEALLKDIKRSGFTTGTKFGEWEAVIAYLCHLQGIQDVLGSVRHHCVGMAEEKRARSAVVKTERMTSYFAVADAVGDAELQCVRQTSRLLLFTNVFEGSEKF